MKSKSVIIILHLVIAILALAIGVVLFNPATAKEPTKMKITSNITQYEGGNLSIKLTDLNKTPVSDEIVNIARIIYIETLSFNHLLYFNEY